MNNVILPENISKLIRIIKENGFDAYAVGGCIRDSLMGRRPHDWDVTTSAKPEEIKRIFRRTIDTGIEHGTVTVLMDRDAYEVTTYRIDGVYKDCRHPSSVRFSSDLKEDLKRRDFTINAIAYNDEEGLVDPFNGVRDIKKGIIRCVGVPEERFSEDALRIMRAVRFSAQLGFEIEPQTRAAIKGLSENLSKISAERIAAELIKTITSPSPEKIRDAYELGITNVVLPEFDRIMQTEQNTKHHIYTVGEHTIRTMMNIAPERILRLTMLFHDMGKPELKTTDEFGTDHFKKHAFASERISKEIVRRLKLDNDTIRNVSLLVLFHDWHLIPDEENVRRLVHALGHELMPAFLAVQWADLAGQSDYNAEFKEKRIRNTEILYERIRERGDCTQIKELKINGNDLLELGLKKGPAVGEILNAALDEVLKDHERNDREYLLGFASDFIKNNLTAAKKGV